MSNSNQNVFQDRPIYQQDFADCTYLGTWYGHDCYVTRTGSVIVRYGSEDHEYASYPNVGWNPLGANCTCGGLGNGRPMAAVEIEGIAGYDNSGRRAYMCALAYIGRELLDGRPIHK